MFCISSKFWLQKSPSLVTLYFIKENFKLFWIKREFCQLNQQHIFLLSGLKFFRRFAPPNPTQLLIWGNLLAFLFSFAASPSLSLIPRLYHLFPVFMVRCRQIATHTHFWFVSRTWNMKFSQNWGNLLDLVPNWPPLFHTSDPSLEMKHEVFSTLCKLQDLVPNWPHLFQIGFQYHWR